MSYFTLEQVQSTITIKNKKRISLIVPYKSTQLIIFYQDCTYQHREFIGSKILHEGKLKYLVTEYVKHLVFNQQSGRDNREQTGGYICVIGRKDFSMHFGIVNVGSKLYQPYEAVFYETKIQSEGPKYQLITETASRYPMLIKITPNIQNGIAVECFDFKRKEWLNDILHMGSKYLSSDLVAMPQNLFGHKNTTFCCLIANGQKSQSLHISCISIVESSHNQQTQKNPHEDSFVSESEQTSTISLQPKQNLMRLFFTKEIKYYRNFTYVGAHIQHPGYLCLVGNSLLFQTPQKRKSQNQTTSMFINFLNLANNQDPDYKFIEIKNSKLQRQIIVRDYLGTIDSSLLFVLQSPGKYTLHRLTPSRAISKQPHYDQELYTFPKSKIIRLQTSLDSNSLISYELVCEQFFEKIKDSPSVIRLNCLMKVDKKMYFKQMLEKVCVNAKENEDFSKIVLSLM